MRPDYFNPYRDRCIISLRGFVLFALGNLNPSGIYIYIYISLSMDPYREVVMTFMRRISSSSETVKLIIKRKVIVLMTGEYVSS